MFNRILFLIYVLALLAPVAVATGDNTGIDLKTAEDYFDEARTQCRLDDGALWGKSLCVPMMFIDPRTRELVANQPDAAGEFVKHGNVYTSTWPKNLNIANSTADYNGTHWTTLLWPLPEEKTARQIILMHESYHNIQGELGLAAGSPSTPALDSREGRIWLRMEWLALRKALLSSADERKQAVKDALIFRARRHLLFPESEETEQAMEIQEGLAEYTGVKLCGLNENEARKYHAEVNFDKYTKVKTFINTFAYWSGPACGLLLDAAEPNWRTGLTPDANLGEMLQTRLGIELPTNITAAADARMAAYGGAEVVAEETAREEENLRLLADYRARLVDGPVLIVPLQKMQIQYDPRGMTSLEGEGTVYATLRVSDVWGVLDVKDRGALMASSWRMVRVSAPDDPEGEQLTGDGWTLELNDGWEIVPAGRPGDYTLELK